MDILNLVYGHVKSCLLDNRLSSPSPRSNCNILKLSCRNIGNHNNCDLVVYCSVYHSNRFVLKDRRLGFHSLNQTKHSLMVAISFP